jgi:hypothetical protein
MDRESGSVELGAYLLQVGNDGGTLVRQDKGGGEVEIESLRRALRRPEPKAEERSPALTSEIDEATEATGRIEQAVALCKGVSEGRGLDPDQLILEVGGLLDCLERLDRKKKHKKAIELARSLATLLMLLKRWASLLQTLRIALRAGRELGDDAAIAWAEHELGTLKLAAGDVEGAERNLHRAREIRERIGDRQDSRDNGTPPNPDGDGQTSDYGLVITIAGGGGGTVVAGGETCSEGVCGFKIATGTVVQFDYKANRDSEFRGFSGDCPIEACTLTMDGPKSVTATFELKPDEAGGSDEASGEGGEATGEPGQVEPPVAEEGAIEEAPPGRRRIGRPQLSRISSVSRKTSGSSTSSA